MSRLLKKLENRFLAEKAPALDRTPMWFLAASEEEIEGRDDLAQEVRQALLDLRENGFAVLPGNIPADLCDALVEEFEDYCASHPAAAEYRDAHGLHSRLALFHYRSDNALKVATMKRTADVVRAAFGGDFTLVGSLLFERGSTQDIHRDTPAFFTNPLNHFFGVWNALEDIEEDSGELCYYRGGHKIARDTELYDDPEVTIDTYFDRVEQACRDAGLGIEKFRPKKGDTLLWLPELPHGGAARNEGLSRRSIVFHYIPTGTPLHGVKEFFNKQKSLFVGENYPVRVRDGTRMIDMGEIRFYHNHKEGNFEEG